MYLVQKSPSHLDGEDDDELVSDLGRCSRVVAQVGDDSGRSVARPSQFPWGQSSGVKHGSATDTKMLTYPVSISRSNISLLGTRLKEMLLLPHVARTCTRKTFCPLTKRTDANFFVLSRFVFLFSSMSPSPRSPQLKLSFSPPFILSPSPPLNTHFPPLVPHPSPSVLTSVVGQVVSPGE